MLIYNFLCTDQSLVVIGGGHAASIAVRAVSKGLIKAKALAAVAPTWSGPLPIVFGRSPTMETRSVSDITIRKPNVPLISLVSLYCM